MPIPVSATVSTAASPSQASEVLTCPPLGVYFTALDSRLIRTRSSWSASPSTIRPLGGQLTSRSRPPAAAAGLITSAAAVTRPARSTGLRRVVNPPISILVVVSMFSIRVISLRAFLSTASSILAWVGSNGPSSSSARIST